MERVAPRCGGAVAAAARRGPPVRSAYSYTAYGMGTTTTCKLISSLDVHLFTQLLHRSNLRKLIRNRFCSATFVNVVIICL